MGLLFRGRNGGRASRWPYRHNPQEIKRRLVTMVWCWINYPADFTYMLCKVVIALYFLVFRGMRKRDLLLRRYWRREDDGTYGTVVWQKVIRVLFAMVQI
jgi:hypothetical protein